MIRYKPISDKILVRLDIKEEKTKHGLYIPDNANQDIRSGIVEEVGPGRWDNGRVPLTVKIGDKVHIGRYSGVEVGSKDLVVITEQEILVIEEACE